MTQTESYLNNPFTKSAPNTLCTIKSYILSILDSTYLHNATQIFYSGFKSHFHFKSDPECLPHLHPHLKYFPYLYPHLK